MKGLWVHPLVSLTAMVWPQELPQGAGGVRNIVANDLDPNAVVPWFPWEWKGKRVGQRVLTLLWGKWSWSWWRYNYQILSAVLLKMEIHDSWWQNTYQQLWVMQRTFLLFIAGWTLKLTASFLHLKMDGWNIRSFPFLCKRPIFQGANLLLVSGCSFLSVFLTSVQGLGAHPTISQTIRVGSPKKSPGPMCIQDKWTFPIFSFSGGTLKSRLFFERLFIW